jgi:hypothetical protein
MIRNRCSLISAERYVLTPKAFANFSPGLERKRQPWVTSPPFVSTLKGLFAGVNQLMLMFTTLPAQSSSVPDTVNLNVSQFVVEWMMQRAHSNTQVVRVMILLLRIAQSSKFVGKTQGVVLIRGTMHFSPAEKGKGCETVASIE